MNNKRVFRTFYYIGGVGMLCGLMFLFYNAYIYSSSVHIIGEITENYVIEKDDSTMYKVIYQYKDVNGLVGTGISSSSSIYKNYSSGDEISLLATKKSNC